MSEFYKNVIRNNVLRKSKTTVMDYMSKNKTYQTLSISFNGDDIQTYKSLDEKKKCIIVFSDKGRAKEVIFEEE